jgi:hypothetical protein
MCPDMAQLSQHLAPGQRCSRRVKDGASRHAATVSTRV